MTSANKTPGGYKFAPLAAFQNDKRTSTSTLALSYLLLGPSRHVRIYYCIPVPYSSPDLRYSVSFRDETFRTLFHHLAPLPLPWAAIRHCSALILKDLRSSLVTVCFICFILRKPARSGEWASFMGRSSGMVRALNGWRLACAPASPAQGLHRHVPIFSYSCMAWLSRCESLVLYRIMYLVWK